MARPQILVLLDRVWMAYPDDVYEALYQAYSSDTKVVELVMQSDPTVKFMRFYSKYFIDFNDMKQYNAYTNKTRKIKLLDKPPNNVPKLKGKLAKIAATSCVPHKEKYSMEKNSDEERQKIDDCSLILTRMNNNWLAYGPDVLSALQRAYCAGHEMVEFVILSDAGADHMKYYSKYVVNFSTMFQNNVYTNKSRKVRFVSKEDVDKGPKKMLYALLVLATPWCGFDSSSKKITQYKQNVYQYPSDPTKNDVLGFRTDIGDPQIYDAYRNYVPF